MEKANPKRLTRLQVMLTADELAALEDFRFEKRMPSLAAAIREILRRGLTADGFNLAGKGVSSSEFGVLQSEVGNGNSAGATQVAIQSNAIAPPRIQRLNQSRSADDVTER